MEITETSNRYSPMASQNDDSDSETESAFSNSNNGNADFSLQRQQRKSLDRKQKQEVNRQNQNSKAPIGQTKKRQDVPFGAILKCDILARSYPIHEQAQIIGENFQEEINDIHPLRSGHFFLAFEKEDDLVQALMYTYIVLETNENGSEKTASCEIHRASNNRNKKATIYRFLNITTAFIEKATTELSRDYKVIAIEPMKKYTNNELVNTGALLLTFSEEITEIPPKIRLYYMQYTTREYIQTPTRCKTCNSYKHSTRRCTAEQSLCRTCGEHHDDINENCENTKKCSNCNENHSAGYRGCKHYLIQAEARKQQANKNISFPQAYKSANKAYKTKIQTHSNNLKQQINREQIEQNKMIEALGEPRRGPGYLGSFNHASQKPDGSHMAPRHWPEQPRDMPEILYNNRRGRDLSVGDGRRSNSMTGGHRDRRDQSINHTGSQLDQDRNSRDNTRQTDRDQSNNNRETEMPPQPPVDKSLEIPAAILQPALTMDTFREVMREERQLMQQNIQQGIKTALVPINAKIEHNTKIVNDVKSEIEKIQILIKEDTMNILDKYKGRIGDELLDQVRQDLDRALDKRLQDSRPAAKPKQNSKSASNEPGFIKPRDRSNSKSRKSREQTRKNGGGHDSKRQKTEEQGHFKDPSTQS
jgi:hypothetical protein